jgi:putative transposase
LNPTFLTYHWSAPTEVVHQLGWNYPVSGGSEMAGKRDKPEDVVMKLRQVEVLEGQGMGIAEAVRQIGVTQQTYDRHAWADYTAEMAA